MKLIIGLGNPGQEYVNTRHNAGHLVADEFQKKKLPKGFVVRKTDVYMNESGSFVGELVNQYKLDLSNLYVVHDDLDIPLGSFKIQFGRGPKDHNGLNDIYHKLGTNEFWHVRVGVDNRPLDGKPLGLEYVLQNFEAGERKVLDKVIKEVCKKLAT